MPSGEDRVAWQTRWQSGHTRWDQGQEHPELHRLLRHAELEGQLQPGATIYSAGCGRAHNEVFLARRGYHVTACDLVPEALSEAKLLYGTQEGLLLRCEDVLQLAAPERENYAAVFDRAMFCALQPSNREAYAAAIAQRLKKGGLFMSIAFRVVDKPEGPPFALDEAAMSALLSKRFDLCWAGAAPSQPAPSSIREEWLCIWRRKEEAHHG